MNKITLSMKNLIKSLSIVGIFCFSVMGYAQDETEFVPKVYTPTSPACVLYANDYEGQSSIVRSQEVLSRNAARGAACATFIVNYSGFTPEAQAAFQYAVDIWGDVY